jgi:hypothetical protein
MEVPITRPKPSYPANYARSPSTNPSTPQDSPSLPSSRKSSMGPGVPGLGGKRNQSYLSLASLSLANSSSSLLGIFSSGLDSVPSTPLPTPPIDSRPRTEVAVEVDRWLLIRDFMRRISVLFALGYAFSMYLGLGLTNVVYSYLWRMITHRHYRISTR